MITTQTGYGLTSVKLDPISAGDDLLTIDRTHWNPPNALFPQPVALCWSPGAMHAELLAEAEHELESALAVGVGRQRPEAAWALWREGPARGVPQRRVRTRRSEHSGTSTRRRSLTEAIRAGAADQGQEPLPEPGTLWLRIEAPRTRRPRFGGNRRRLQHSRRANSGGSAHRAPSGGPRRAVNRAARPIAHELGRVGRSALGAATD